MRTLDTLLVHAGTPSPRPGGAVVSPIYQSANYLQDDAETYGSIRYMRLSNTPSHGVLAARMAAITGGADALLSTSGMAAISATLLGLLSSGDHVLVQRNVYGGTRTLLQRDCARMGITHTDVDASAPDTWAAALQPSTRLFYVESVSNPLMQVPELRAVLAFARAHGLLAVIDNTFLSPVNLRPLELGFDLVVHSATKYLNGHSDLVAGVVAGSAELVDTVRHAQAHLGGSLDAHACFLLERGLKTLALRVRRQNDSALRLATALSRHPAIAEVHYPGLPDDPGHRVASELFAGYGGMFALRTRDAAAAERFLSAVRIPLHAASLGGVETLVVRPSRSSHLGMSPGDRAACGIDDALVRVSVGIEDPDELEADLTGALS